MCVCAILQLLHSKFDLFHIVTAIEQAPTLEASSSSLLQYTTGSAKTPQICRRFTLYVKGRQIKQFIRLKENLKVQKYINIPNKVDRGLS